MNTNKKPLVSICCLGYNHANFIKQNIQAIQNSNYDNIEIIVVDDGSTDNSAKILQDLSKNVLCDMHVILQKNTGNIGHNFNVALRQARGVYISFISLDDVLTPNAITTCVNVLKSDKRLAFVASSCVAGIDSDGAPYNNIPPLKLSGMTNVSIDDLLELEYSEFGAFYIQGAFFLFVFIEAVGGFDEDMTGDDLVLRTKVFRYMQQNPNLSFMILSQPLCFYRQHSGNVHLNYVRQMKIVTEYMERYWPNRPNPKILVDWGAHALRNLPKEKWYNFFIMNNRVLTLLKEPKIINFLKSMDVKESVWFKIPFVLSISKTKNFITGERNVWVNFLGLKLKIYHKEKH